jgi:8-oxo-dGTP diphosphatase
LTPAFRRSIMGLLMGNESTPAGLPEIERLYPAHALVGVGAVILQEGKILLVKRARDPGKGMWSVPGGMVELGETLAEAVRREVLEECGIEVVPGGVFDTAETILHDDEDRVKYHFVIIDFNAAYRGGEVRGGSDAEECRWVALGDLAEYDLPESLRETFLRHGLTGAGR